VLRVIRACPAAVGGHYKADETNFKKKDNAETQSSQRCAESSRDRQRGEPPHCGVRTFRESGAGRAGLKPGSTYGKNTGVRTGRYKRRSVDPRQN